VDIKEVVDVEATTIDFDPTIQDGKPFKVKVELQNTGSIGYKARVRLDILDQDNLIFTGWGDEKYFFPGNQKIYDLYWYPLNIEGELKALIIIYYANEMKKVKLVKFEVEASEKSPENIFEILDFRTYDDEVEFLLKTNKTVENVIIIPFGYPTGWIFEQVKVDELESGSVKIVNLKYDPSLWKETSVMFNMISEDGKYHASESFTMKRENSFWSNVYKIIHNLRVILNF